MYCRNGLSGCDQEFLTIDIGRLVQIESDFKHGLGIDHAFAQDLFDEISC